MALPGSGTITLQMIATELGVSLPLDLNATNVRALAGKPTGTITMPNDFWGKSNTDYIPDAMAWEDTYNPDDMTGTGQSQTVPVGAQTVSGVTPSITLLISVPSFNVNCSGSGATNITAYLDVIKNGVFSSSITKFRNTTGSTTSSGSTTVTVANGDTLDFVASCQVGGGLGGASGGASGTVSVINQSSSDTVLDTFTFLCEATYDGGGLG